MPANWKPKTIWTGDCLDIMRGMNSESVDLVYLDPPFNSRANYAAPIGSKAAGAAFKDTWTLSDVDVEWINLIEAKHPALYRVLLAAMTDSDKSYLAYMAARILEMRRVLKLTGSIYLHCDPTMSHYLKLVMDAIFGRSNFRNVIVWHYRNKLRDSRKKVWQSATDMLLFYTCSEEYVFNPQFEKLEKPTKYSKFKKVDGKKIYVKDKKGNQVYVTRDEKLIDNVLQIPLLMGGKERLGYPTQKPLKLMDRIIQASSNKGDIILDPFCGCATTCVAADAHRRNWAGIDISPKAAELVRERIDDPLRIREIVHRTDIPRRTDMGALPAPRTHRKALYGDQGGDCNGCGTHFEMQHFEVDHIISKRRGGTDHSENLQLLCSNCNRIKGDRGMEYLRSKLQLTGRKPPSP